MKTILLILVLIISGCATPYSLTKDYYSPYLGRTITYQVYDIPKGPYTKEMERYLERAIYHAEYKYYPYGTFCFERCHSL